MKCDFYRKHDSGGEISEVEFNTHLKICGECAGLKKKDDDLMKLAARLRHPLKAPGLWSRIETDLKNEKRKPKVRPGKILFRIAALLIVVIAFGYLYRVFQSGPDVGRTGILVESALARVEEKEEEYFLAIEELEKEVLPCMHEMDPLLAKLYRNKLRAIDLQIKRCGEALDRNPANKRIRFYMLAALRDKKEALKEISSQVDC